MAAIGRGRGLEMTWTGVHRHFLTFFGMVAATLALSLRPAAAQSPAATIIGDFEDDSIAASISATENVLLADCRASRQPIPARGQYSLGLEIGATQPNVSATCDLVFRTPARFDSIDELGGFIWVKTAPVEVAYRLVDAAGQEFETPPQKVSELNRWASVIQKFDAAKLKRVSGKEPLAWPLQVAGWRVRTTTRGRQTIYLDDLQVLHRVPLKDLLSASYRFDEPTRIYSPGAKVAAQVSLENRSRETALALNLQLAWTDARDEVVRKQDATMNLPAASKGFRSVQTLDFSETISTPGVYRLIVRARAAGWTTPATFETTIAVTPTNRFLTRGRSHLFGIRTNLLRETTTDQLLELAIARDLGAQVVLIDVPWAGIEPRDDGFEFDRLAPLLDELAKGNIAAGVSLTGRPEWLPEDAAARESQLGAVARQLAQVFSGKLRMVQLSAEALEGLAPAETIAIAQRVQSGVPSERVLVLPPKVDVTSESGANLELPGAAPWVAATSGFTPGALREISAAASRNGWTWNENAYWEHRNVANAGAGVPVDAVDVLRHYVAAAAAKAGGLFWFDLRDDDVVSVAPDAIRGLVRRDFSPKVALLGYLSAAAMLSDLAYAGPVHQAPPEYESALFIGSDRHVAVFIPRPNQRRPATIGLVAGVKGKWEIRRFDRAPGALLAEQPSPLLVAPDEPIYVTLRMDSTQPRPQVGCAPAWLRGPGVVLTDEPARFEVELPSVVKKGFWQVNTPNTSPLRAGPSSGAIAGAARQVIPIEFEVTSRPNQPFVRGEITLRLKLDNHSVELPIEVRPGVTMKPAPGATVEATPTYRLGEATPTGAQRGTAKTTLYGAYASDEVRLLIEVDDDRVTRPGDRPDRPGDHLRVGVAAAGAADHIEFELRDQSDAVEVVSLYGDTSTVRATRTDAGSIRKYQITVPAAALGVSTLDAGAKLLLGCEYLDDDHDSFAPLPLEWGQGVGTRRSTADYRWVRLVGGS
jgi:hypothetical protein